MSDDNHERQYTLESTKALLRQFIEHAPAPIAMFDRDMKYIMASRRFLTDYHLTLQDVVGRSHYEIFPEIPERWKAIHRRCLAGATERAEDDPFPRADGTLDWVCWEIQPWHEASGAIGGIILFSEVITERKRAEEALRSLTSRYEAILAAVPDIIMAVDNNKVYTWANRAGHEFFGNDVIGKEAASYFEGTQATYDIVRPLFTGSEGLFYVESWQRRKDGERRLLAWWYHVVKDEKGNVAGAMSTARDITERHQAERALAGSQQLQGLILESVEDGIHGLDLDGRIVFENSAALKMFGWRPEEMIGQYSHTLIHHHRADGRPYPVEECPVYRTLYDGQVRHVHNEVFFRKDGTSFPVEYTASALRDDSDAIVGAIVAFRDITELKQLQKQFLQSQKLEAVGELAGGIAHDFNNNLSAILGFSDLALDRLRPEDSVHRYITQVKKAGEQSAALTRQLLAFSRKQLLQLKVLDLNALIADLKIMLQRMIGESIALHLRLHPELGHVRADPGQLEQVLVNLVVNARDAMPNSGTLTLETGNVDIDEAYACARPPMLAGPYVRLVVADTGHGMDAKTQARMFEPFFTTKERGKGTGLGLSTVYGIIKQSGGYIWVDSTPGQGTTFTIDLPRVEASLEPVRLPERSTPPYRSAATVLLVEDEEMVRAVARDTLQAQGYTVLEAMNGGAALLISERHQGTIDLLLTDVVMPYMSGPELAERLTAQRPAMRVLYMSGYTDDALAPHGVLQPVTAFLAKPFTPDSLLRAVREALEAAV